MLLGFAEQGVQVQAFLYFLCAYSRERPQKAHTDYNPNVMKWERKNFNCYSCIGITPLHPDGCMIFVWTEGMRKKSRTVEEIRFDEKRSKKNIDPKPGQYFLYIPKGTMLILPGDTIHAGGFCLALGWIIQVPRKLNSRITGFISFFVALTKL